jgi:hypothetical protein
MMMGRLGVRHRLRPVGWALVLALLAGAARHPARAQPVQGDVRSVGFQAAVQSRFVVRDGQWFPIVAELIGQGTQAYDVELRCEREDLDGDRVAYVKRHVAIDPDTPGRVWCYAVSIRETAGQPMTLDVIGSDGALITKLPVPLFESISNNTELILDISANRVTALDALDSGATAYNSFMWGERRYYRSICVATLPPRDVPDHWWGLEAADVIIWDEPDPAALPSPAQLTALIEWVRNGGRLVVGIGPAWSKVQKSALAEIMPLTGTRPPVEVDELPTFAGRHGRPGRGGLEAPISVAVGEPAEGAVVTFKDRLPNGVPFNLIAMKTVGSGRVIALAARLRDLTGGLGAGRTFYHEFLDLNPNEPEFRKNEAEALTYMFQVTSLYSPVIAQIEFQRSASARVLAAFAFVAAYILVSTFGAWVWLKRHALTHLSWATFAAFAIAASLLSLGAVGLSRGIAGKVHNYSFVDLEAGSNEARATAYFGYKSSRRQRVDMSLPGAEDFLRPLTSSPEPSGPGYATPERYVALPGRATLEGTPLRATLKQFEGFWHGELVDSIGGKLTIRGDLVADRRTGQLTPQSWLQNDLTVEIVGGYALYIDPRLRQREGVDRAVPYRVAGLTKRNDRPDQENEYYGSDAVPPAINVLAARLPALEPGQRAAQLGKQEYDQYVSQYARWAAGGKPDPKDEPMLKTLWHRQVEEWAPTLTATFGGALDPRDAAGLLASTRDLYVHGKFNPRDPDFGRVGQPVSTSSLRNVDVTHWLTGGARQGQAVLLLIAAEPGPAQLQLNGWPVESSAGRTLYRVRIPIRYSGQPPRGA